LSLISTARAQFHADLKQRLLVLNAAGKPSNADQGSGSTAIAAHMAQSLAAGVGPALKPQETGDEFERIVAGFLEGTFLGLDRLRPGLWQVLHVKSRSGTPIANYEQYSHLGDIERAAKGTPELRVLLGLDYNIASDVVIARHPEPDALINAESQIVDGTSAARASIRADLNAKPSLHACVSCKWTLRSDRAQSARSEALNLIRSRRGRTPHIVVVTAEPLPSRLTSLALGTGDIDCVYHIALPELEAATHAKGQQRQRDLLSLMIDQRRLKDISDLPLDLAI
jgi:hypothetical protein